VYTGGSSSLPFGTINIKGFSGQTVAKAFFIMVLQMAWVYFYNWYGFAAFLLLGF
jgi:hypothetical protein